MAFEQGMTLDQNALGAAAPQPMGGGMGGSQASMAGFNQWLSTLPPEEAEALRAAMASDPNAASKMYQNQMTMANKLRETPSARGQTTRSNIYTEANPLEHLNTGLSRGLGAIKYGQAENAYEESEEARRLGLRGAADYLRSAGMQGV